MSAALLCTWISSLHSLNISYRVTDKSSFESAAEKVMPCLVSQVRSIVNAIIPVVSWKHGSFPNLIPVQLNKSSCIRIR